MKNILSSIALAAISLAALGAWSYLIWSNTLDQKLTAVTSGIFALAIVIIAFINIKLDGIQKDSDSKHEGLHKLLDSKFEGIQQIIDKGTDEHAKLWEANTKQNERMDALLLALVSPESARQKLQSKENHT